MSAPSFSGARAARGREIGGDDRPDAAALQRHDHREPDRAAADDHRDAARPRIGDRDCMGAHRQRLGERRDFGEESVRHRQQQRFGQRHALGECAAIAGRKADQFGAERTESEGRRNDARPGGKPLFGARPMVEDLGTELVPEHQILRRIDRVGRAAAAADLDAMFQMMDGVQVRPANAAGKRFRDDLPRFRYYIGNVGDGQRGAAADRRAHRGSAHFAPASSVGLRWPSQPGFSLRRPSTILSQKAAVLPLKRMSKLSAVRNSSTSTPSGPGL
jgi:hypothetical protein